MVAALVLRTTLLMSAILAPKKEFGFHLTRSLRRVSGSMVGNIARVPLSNTTFGRS